MRNQIDYLNRNPGSSSRELIDGTGGGSFSKENSSPKIIGVPMKNDLGEQNCYVNVILHAIYHMKEFRQFFMEEEIPHETRWNIFFELKLLFEKYEDILSPFSKIPDQFKYIDPFDFRKELASLFKEDKKFEMNLMGDPVDLFFAVLNAFHARSLNASSVKYILDKPCSPQCMAHSLLWINLLEQYECVYCGATSEVLQYDYNYFIYEVYVKEVLTSIEKKKGLHGGKLFHCLKELNAITKEVCPEKCARPNVKKNTFLLSTNSYFCYNLTWRETNPKLTDICKLFYMIPLTFKNKDLFELYDLTNVKTYQLLGLICYWGAHYICFFKSNETDDTAWIYYDDNNISKISKWEDLVVKCIKNHFHPTMLFYRLVDREKEKNSTDMKNSISEESYAKILTHCNRVDKENELQYKNEETLSSRLRPSLVEMKKVSDPQVTSDLTKRKKIKVIKKETGSDSEDEDEDDLKKKEEAKTSNENNLNFNQDISKQIEDKKINEKTELEKENFPKGNKLTEEKKSTSEEMPHIREDEWICEKAGCKNINEMSKYICLKCRAINMNIYDIIQQRKQYEERKIEIKDASKRGRSMIPVARKEIIPISTPKPNDICDNQNMERETSNNTSPIVCDNCHTTNLYWKMRCEHCRLPLAQPNSNENNIERKIVENKDRTNLTSINNSYNYKPIAQNIPTNIPLSSAGDDFLRKSQENAKARNENTLLSQNHYWQCEKCMFTNTRDHCLKCKSNRPVYKIDSYFSSSSPRNDMKNVLNSSLSGTYNQTLLKRNSLKESYPQPQLLVPKGNEFQKPVTLKTKNTNTVSFSANEIIRNNNPQNNQIIRTNPQANNIKSTNLNKTPGSLSSSLKSQKNTSTQTYDRDDNKTYKKYYM